MISSTTLFVAIVGALIMTAWHALNLIVGIMVWITNPLTSSDKKLIFYFLATSFTSTFICGALGFVLLQFQEFVR